ncbi:hypothetical protein TWF694_010481 [Orbilia ellipsospora]|uniref:Uncharacterized protein n=1 Tax=Orbilia ellipsospora TaxID=2528407 RepID=A0AAV9XA07_9PEZI
MSSDPVLHMSIIDPWVTRISTNFGRSPHYEQIQLLREMILDNAHRIFGCPKSSITISSFRREEKMWVSGKIKDRVRWTSEVVGFRPAGPSGHHVVRIGAIRGRHQASCMESLDHLFLQTSEVLAKEEPAMLEVEEPVAEAKAAGVEISADAAAVSSGGGDEKGSGKAGEGEGSESKAPTAGRGRQHALGM